MCVIFLHVKWNSLLCIEFVEFIRSKRNIPLKWKSLPACCGNPSHGGCLEVVQLVGVGVVHALSLSSQPGFSPQTRSALHKGFGSCHTYAALEVLVHGNCVLLGLE
uniref:Uncharacterized protein n=1 Tax=Physcomitrium patens TaxID=3218 RepID=A0A2K1ITZ2_PHYPA|nr:hypothetical protein PHYPA_024670 [Physcomitrium patens]